VRTGFLLVVVLVALAGGAPAALAAPAPGPYEGTSTGRFFGIIPPGEAGVANALQAAAFTSNGTQPPHFADQRDPYSNLLYATPGLGDADIGTYFPDASFGARPDDVERTYAPREDVTIVRDKSFGIPHVYGASRAGTSFGIGYAVAEDRLFFMDVLRHYGNATLASFAGGANVETDRDQWEIAPYTPEDLDHQVAQLPRLYGQAGQNLVDDAQAWCDGVNAYIAKAKLDPSLLPVEYPAINRPQGPDPWKVTDVLNVASLIGAQLGKGGGDELDQVQLLMADMQRFGAARGLKIWQDLRSEDDPEAPVTATRTKGFPYDQIPRKPLKAVALPDPGTLRFVATTVGEPDAARSAAPRALPSLLHFPTTDSNALLVSARKSATGHPLAVFGAQAGYFQPEIFWAVDAHGPGFDVRGANIPGTGPYVELGRGRDYAWSATSASQDIIDVYALDLCNQDGSKATLASTAYVFRGRCEPMETVDRTESWSPSAADQTAAGSVTFRKLRTKMGLVEAKATIKGVPVVYTKLRSTYEHELDSAPGFQAFNDPDQVHDVRSFQRAAAKIGYTFNWFYTDDKDIGYINTGANPERAARVNGLLPVRYSPGHEWHGFDPQTNLATYQPIAQRPQAINQDVLVSWNNKQAHHCCGGSEYTPVWRSELLTDRLDAKLRNGGKVSLAQVVDVMAVAGTADLRGDAVLPWVLKVLGTPADPKLAAAATTLRGWSARGAHRFDGDRDGHYDDADAVRIMDAWYTTLPKAVFGAKMGKAVFARYDAHDLADTPNSFKSQLHAHLGSAWEDGWYGFIQKDLRTLVKPEKVTGRYHAHFCGNGKLAACRAALTASLAEALALDPVTLYADPTLKAGDCGAMDAQACFDALRFRPLGVVKQPMIPWQNRPTQQQVVEVTGHRPR
jgi:acyl-homoserine lactone acylase PvdQ